MHLADRYNKEEKVHESVQNSRDNYRLHIEYHNLREVIHVLKLQTVTVLLPLIEYHEVLHKVIRRDYVHV